jgi:hypothetical protein
MHKKRVTGRDPRRWLRAAVAATIGAAGLVSFASPASALQTIDTRAQATSTVSSFGLPNTSTYGQVITVPAGETVLTSFSFILSVPTQVQFRGAVYAWDAGLFHAVGAPLFVGPTQTTPVGTASEIVFNTGPVTVTSGQQYVILATASFDDGPAGTGHWALTPSDVYAGGTMVYLNNGTDEAQLTTNTWSDFGRDLGFQANFGIPGPGTNVSVNASTANAVEGGADGAFTFTRTGDTSQNLTVGYSLGGSAVSGTDYDPPGTVIIPAGQNSRTVPVHALVDNVPDDGETVTAVVSEGAGYSVGQPAQATVTINDPTATACDNATPSSYTDRDAVPVHAGNIDCITQYGIAQGFPDNTYRPTVPTTRPQIASFIARVMSAAGVSLPASPPDAFPGDNAGPPHELSINQLAALGVLDATTGQDGDKYGVGANMRRDDMAGMLYNAYNVITGSPLPDGPNAFTDDEGNDNEAAINALFAAGVVEGDGAGTYNPSGTVTRGSMASFLARYVQVLVDAGFLDPLPASPPPPTT